MRTLSPKSATLATTPRPLRPSVFNKTLRALRSEWMTWGCWGWGLVGVGVGVGVWCGVKTATQHSIVVWFGCGLRVAHRALTHGQTKQPTCSPLPPTTPTLCTRNPPPIPHQSPHPRRNKSFTPPDSPPQSHTSARTCCWWRCSIARAMSAAVSSTAGKLISPSAVARLFVRVQACFVRGCMI